tara:strand:- start:286 stop:753 length:468 start_codon:yes stop_codon:yes gene_type:complete
MKRFTYWPQLFLGFTFNYGLIMAWMSLTNEFSFYPLLFYFGAIFWTLGYDTIYGYQDIKDDEIIGLKSTSIKFKENPYKFLYICYTSFLLSMFITGYMMELNNIFFILLSLVVIQVIFFQLKKLDIKLPESCLNIFKSNNLLGLTVYLTFLLGKI